MKQSSRRNTTRKYLFSEIENGYSFAKKKLQELQEHGINSGPRFHLLRAICLSCEALKDIEENSRFYVPKAINSIVKKAKGETGRSSKYTGRIKYPNRNHRLFSEWLDPDNNLRSFIYEVKQLALELCSRKTIIDCSPQDIRNLAGYVKFSLKGIRRHIPLVEITFLKYHIVQACEICESLLDSRQTPSNPFDTLQDILLWLNDFKNLIVAESETIEQELTAIARRQKKRNGKLPEDISADKKKQWELFCDPETENRYPNVSERERYVLKKFPLADGYNTGGLRRRWYRKVGANCPCLKNDVQNKLVK